MFQISTKMPFKTIITAHLHTSAAGVRDTAPGYLCFRLNEVTLGVGSNPQIGF